MNYVKLLLKLLKVWYNNIDILVEVFDDEWYDIKGGFKMTAEQRMWKMLRIFEQEKVVENIESCSETEMSFNAIKSCLVRDIELLKEELKVPIMLKKEISVEQAIGIVLICLMAEIDDSDLLDRKSVV